MRHPLLTLAAATVVGMIALAGLTTAAIWRQGLTDEARPADAIVVLGAAQYDGVPSPIFEARLAHAVDLFLQGRAPVLVVTGGKATGDRTTEAAAARAYAMAHGVPADAILSEDQGRTTLESLRNVARLFATRNLRSAVFVSDRTHMLRVLRIASDEGLVAWGSPTTTSPLESDPGGEVGATLHELGALAVYFVGRGRFTAADLFDSSP